MYCDNCGNQLRDGAKFCNKCGQPVTEISDNSTNYQKSTTRTSDSPLPREQQYAVPQSQSANQYQQQVYQPQPQPYYAPGTHPYHSLGGFLAFIVVANYISGILTLIAIIPTFITYIRLIKMGEWIERTAHGFTSLCVFGMIGMLIVCIISATAMI